MPNRIQNSDYVVARAWTTDGEQASVQRFWYQCDSDTGVGCTDLQMAQQLEALLAPLYKPAMNNNATWNGVEVQIQRAGLWFAEAFSVTNAGAGTGGALALPRQSCGLISWTTPLAGRAYRGRMYLPFPSVTHDVGNGVPTAAYVTLALAIEAAWRTTTFFGDGSGSIRAQPIIKHGPTKGDPPVPPVSPWTLITNGAVINKWATQRRRGSYGRANSSPI